MSNAGLDGTSLHSPAAMYAIYLTFSCLMCIVFLQQSTRVAWVDDQAQDSYCAVEFDEHEEYIDVTATLRFAGC